MHSSSEAAAAGPVDYLIAGTLWPTTSKGPDQPLLGEQGFAAIAAASVAPVLAIGGIHLARVARVAALGGSGVAAIGAWIGESAACRAIPLTDLAHSFREAFAAANMDPQAPQT